MQRKGVAQRNSDEIQPGLPATNGSVRLKRTKGGEQSIRLQGKQACECGRRRKSGSGLRKVKAAAFDETDVGSEQV